MTDKVYIIALVIYVLVIAIDTYVWLQNRNTNDALVKRRRIISALNFTIFVVAISLTLISAIFHVNFLINKRSIEHANSDLISLQDFRGIKLPGQSLDGVEEFAFIVTSIEWYKNEDYISVKALFHPGRSYVYNENLVDKFLLRHEIYHFHITEYCARLIRKEISMFKTTPQVSAIDEVVTKYRLFESRLQYQYDEDSYHSYILKEQKRWEMKVDSLLIAESDFKNTELHLR